jgi:hypothetical protein
MIHILWYLCFTTARLGYFQFYLFSQRFLSAIGLNRVVKLLNDYPDMTIELSSHTDARGSDEYNLILSQNRADAVKRYLVKQGISSYRLTAKGYGETKLVNGCNNGVQCTENQHQENRRTEFTILSCSSCR